MKKILITDDEPLAIQKIEDFLERCLKRGSYQFETAVNGVECLERLRSFQPDLLFLDIQMPEIDGFDVVALMPEARRETAVIFQTAYDEYAIRAFEENACDYLLKPFSLERFERALTRAMGEIDARTRLARLEDGLKVRERHLTKLISRQGLKSRILPVADIAAFTSEDHCTLAHLIDGTEAIVDLPLSELETRLDPRQFARVHRKHVVALARVRSVVGGDEPGCELATGLRVPVSRRQKARLMDLFTSVGKIL